MVLLQNNSVILLAHDISCNLIMSSEGGEKIYPQGYEPENAPKATDPNLRNQLLDFILKSGPSEVVDTGICLPSWQKTFNKESLQINQLKHKKLIR